MVFEVSPTPLNANAFFCRILCNLTLCMTKLRVLVQQSNSVNVVFLNSLILKHYTIISLKPGFQHQKHTCHVGFLKSALTYMSMRMQRYLCHTLKMAQQCAQS
jgi:hypothetical protein